MFLASYEKLRKKMHDRVIVNMAHLGARAFEEISGEIVQTVSWIMTKEHYDYIGIYERLVDANSQDEKEELFLSNTAVFTYEQQDFKEIPNMPVAYWVSKEFRKLFVDGESITRYISSRDGLTTGNNDQFIKYFWEVGFEDVSYSCCDSNEFWNTNCKFAPLIKGGSYRKWYGNNSFVITYDLEGYNKLSNCGNKLPSRDVYFSPYITWNRISTKMAFRFCIRPCKIWINKY